ncbi:MAG: LacI family DNA-binding transcriptional regulator, partial [Lachnospiraceae bacterium]|nr:LacI family DNA-binding transcriptional regulator [Lachnospiraceae bacterium]
MSNKVTIQKIAEMAGVSRGTVDRVLNNRSYVQKDVRDRVLEIVRETGYVSQREAHLREREDRSKELCIGVLLPNPQFGVQFLEEVKQGIENAQTGLEDSNVKILVRQCESELPEEAVSLIDELMKKGARGV